MRIQHKQARDTVIALNVGRFEVDAAGFLKPTPTHEQWRRFADAQCYFNIVEDASSAATSEALSDTAALAVAPPAEATVWTPDGVQPASLAPEAIDEWEDEDVLEDDSEGAEAFRGDVEDLDAVETDEPTMYGSMDYQALKALCKERGIGVARASRTELISRLNAQDLGV